MARWVVAVAESTAHHEEYHELDPDDDGLGGSAEGAESEVGGCGLGGLGG